MSRPSERWIATEVETLACVLDRLGSRAALDQGRVFVAGRRARDLEELLPIGASVEIYPPRASPSRLRVLRAQSGLVFVDKPPGIATEPERRGASGTLVSLVAEELGVPVESVHALSRLDVGVSGVVLLGITADARRRVTDLRAQGEVIRRYVAISAAAPEPEQGIWSDSIGRASASSRRQASAQGERAETAYRVTGRAAARQGLQSVLAFEPLTGRTHQLRVHAAAHGAPLLGDRTYGGPGRLVSPSGEVSALTRVFLHAAWIQLGDQERVQCPLPEDFLQVWQALGGEAVALGRAIDEPVRTENAARSGAPGPVME
jgi:23S rRNA-/tRNA-specific pseudouridylate synthase